MIRFHEARRDLASLRAQVLLLVVVQAMRLDGKPPAQSQLMWVDGRESGGLLNEYWREQQVDRRFPTGYTSNSHISNAAQLLAERGLFIPRGRHVSGEEWSASAYRATPEGIAYAESVLEQTDWTQWPDFEEE